MRRVCKLAAVALAAGVLAAPAEAASTRAEYVAQVEPICRAAQKPTFKAYSAYLKKAPGPVDVASDPKRAGRTGFRALGRLFTRVSNIYGQTTARIAAVPPAPGDEATVAAWLGERNQATLLGVRSGRAATHQKAKQFKRLLDQTILASEQAAGTVSAYGLEYCALLLGEATSG